MPKIFASADKLSDFLDREREDAVSQLSRDLAVSRESLAFIFEETETDSAALEIPCRREVLLTD